MTDCDTDNVPYFYNHDDYGRSQIKDDNETDDPKKVKCINCNIMFEETYSLKNHSRLKEVWKNYTNDDYVCNKCYGNDSNEISLDDIKLSIGKECTYLGRSSNSSYSSFCINCDDYSWIQVYYFGEYGNSQDNFIIFNNSDRTICKKCAKFIFRSEYDKICDSLYKRF